MAQFVCFLTRRYSYQTFSIKWQTKKIELNIPSEILPRPELEAHTVTYITASEEPLKRDPSGPKSASDSHYTEQGDNSQEEPTSQTASCLETEPGGEAGMERSGDTERSGGQFISTEELKANRLSEKGILRCILFQFPCRAETSIVLYLEMQEYSVYNKYSPGERSMRLYIKNLGKHVEEKVHVQMCDSDVEWCEQKELKGGHPDQLIVQRELQKYIAVYEVCA